MTDNDYWICTTCSCPCFNTWGYVVCPRCNTARDDDEEITEPFRFIDSEGDDPFGWKMLDNSTHISKGLADILEPLTADEPKTNDGRRRCFWCDKKTVKRCIVNNFYLDYCKSCNK